MKKLNSKGFGAIEGLLIVVIVGIIGFVGWYVWDQNKQADKSVTSSTSTPTVTTTKNAKTEAKQVAKLEKFKSEAELNAIQVSGEETSYETISPKVEVFKGAPQDLIDWAKQYVVDNANDLPAYGVKVTYLSKNKIFAIANSNAKLILKKDGSKWAVIPDAGGQSATECKVIEQYLIPGDVLAVCTTDKSNQSFANTLHNTTE